MVKITKSTRAFEMKIINSCFSKNCNIKYLIIDDIYQLAKLASENNSHTKNLDLNNCESLASYIDQNNTKITNKLPETFTKNITDIISQLRKIKINDELEEKKEKECKEYKDLNFILVSKQLLQRNRFFNFKSFTMNDYTNITEMIESILMILYNNYEYKINVNISAPINSKDIEMYDYCEENSLYFDMESIERRMNAYDAVDINPPITIEKLLSEKEYKKRKHYKNLLAIGKGFVFVISIYVLFVPIISFMIVRSVVSCFI